MKVVKQTQSLRVPYGTITSLLKYANTLPGWQMGKVSREEMVRKFSRKTLGEKSKFGGVILSGHGGMLCGQRMDFS